MNVVWGRISAIPSMVMWYVAALSKPLKVKMVFCCWAEEEEGWAAMVTMMVTRVRRMGRVGRLIMVVYEEAVGKKQKSNKREPERRRWVVTRELEEELFYSTIKSGMRERESVWNFFIVI